MIYVVWTQHPLYLNSGNFFIRVHTMASLFNRFGFYLLKQRKEIIDNMLWSVTRWSVYITAVPSAYLAYYYFPFSRNISLHSFSFCSWILG